MAPAGLIPPTLRRCVSAMLPPLILLLAAGCSTGAGGAGPSPSPFSSILAFYEGPLDHLSAVRRGVCPKHPSCSAYARQAVARHGEGLGWIMACDRLMRCGRDEARLAPKIRVNGQWRYHDPVERNDFWWQEEPAGTLGGAAGPGEGRGAAMPGDINAPLPGGHPPAADSVDRQASSDDAWRATVRPESTGRTPHR